MAWLTLDITDTLNTIIEASHDKPQFIFKHSTRCSISFMAMSRIEEVAKKTDIYIIDVIKHRDISKAAEQMFSVVHQSPQLLVVVNGKCVDNISHMGISSASFDRHMANQT